MSQILFKTMNKMKILFLIVLLSIVATSSAKKKVVCYFEGWAVYRNGDGKYSYKDINVKMCTHVAYAFAGLKSNGDIKIPNDIPDLSKFTSYIKQNGAKALLSVGGASEGSKKFSDIVSNPHVRTQFVTNAMTVLKKYDFDGLDVDWEYPSQNSGSRKSDKDNFVELLKELKEAFSKKNYILSAAVAADADSVAKSYKVAQVAQYLDFINVMSYDYHGSWDSKTGMNAALYASKKDNDYEKTLNLKSTVNYWLSHGAPAEKIIVGIPFYGRTFILKNADKNGVHSPVSGPGKAGKYTEEEGYLGYNELCVKLRKGGWTIIRDKERRVPYAYKGTNWMSYDDVKSIKEKMDFIKSMGLGGAMIWSIDTDDFKGNCGAKHPLLTAINEAL